MRKKETAQKNMPAHPGSPDPKEESAKAQLDELKSLLYDAYGVCSYLSAWQDEGIQDLFNQELLAFAAACENSPEYADEIAAMMISPDDQSPEDMLDKIRLSQRAKPFDFSKTASIVLPEFAWADQRMHSQNPSMTFSPLKNLYRLYLLAADCSKEAAGRLQKVFAENGLHDFEGMDQACIRFRKAAPESSSHKNSAVPAMDEKKKEPEKHGKEDSIHNPEDKKEKPQTSPLDFQSRMEVSERLNEILKELDEMTGLSEVKDQVHSLSDYLQIQKIRKELGLQNPSLSRHMIFYGNPGTGKTTVARLLGRIFKELGLLKTGQLIETDRSGMVAGYIGQTAQKTQELIQKALGGILFIDEAYALIRPGSNNDFGREAVETLLKAMEDHRDDLVVIAAGYPQQMDEFLASNPGLSSRFGTRIHFNNYSLPELLNIAASMAEHMDYVLDEGAQKRLEQSLAALTEEPTPDFGNARTVRNILERAMMKQAERLMKKKDLKPEDLRLLTEEDFILSAA